MRRFLEKLAGVTVHLDRPPVDPKERRYTERVIRLSVQNLARMPNAAALNARFQAGGVVRGPGWSARLEKTAAPETHHTKGDEIYRGEVEHGGRAYVHRVHVGSAPDDLTYVVHSLTAKDAPPIQHTNEAAAHTVLLSRVEARGLHAAEVRGMYVHPQHRGTGLGRKLWELVGRAHPHATIYVVPDAYKDAAKSNDALHEVYHRYGFEQHDGVALVRHPTAREKTAEYAPGIPDKKRIAPITEPAGRWAHVEQEHLALRAGKHTDLRLAHGEDAHSWAVRHMPQPGEQVLAKQQPTHSRKYMEFQGVIPHGYGAGTVKRLRGGHAEVVEATPHHIAYNVYEGKKAHEYALTQVGRDPRDWLLRNRSTVRGKYPIPTDKPKYREEPYSADLAAKPGALLPKVDGGHSITMLETGKRPRVFSYREGKRGDVLEYTHKIPGMFAQKVPPGLVRGRMLVRGETFLQEGGRALGPNRTAALLNSSIDKARRAQEGGAQLRVMPFDIMGDKSPYPDRLKKLQEIARVLHGFVAPEAAHTPREKAKLIHAIQSGRHPLTSEGVVRFPPGHIGGEGAVKAKLVAEQDVLVHSVFPGKGRHEGRAGGFTYSREAGGKPVGRVGTGLSDREREWLWRHRDAVRGRVAKVTHDRQTRSGALYAPRVAKGAGFLGWHLDKNLGA